MLFSNYLQRKSDGSGEVRGGGGEGGWERGKTAQQET